MSSSKRDRSSSPTRREEFSSADYNEAEDVEQNGTQKKKGRWDSGAEKPGGITRDSVLAVKEALAKAKQAAAIQQQLQERLQQTGIVGGLGLGDAAAMLQNQENKWAPLRLDKLGRQVDEAGNVVKMDKSHLQTLKVNKNLDLAAKAAESNLLSKVPSLDETQHFDPRVYSSGLQRDSRRAFRWSKPGKHVARAQTMRMKQLTRDMSSDYDMAGEEITVRRVIQLEPIPVVEWWDEAVLNEESYDSGIKEGAISNLIHIPIMLAPVTDAGSVTPQPLMLTQKERKKIKRINKKEKQKEEQDKIRLGLMSPPEPKMRMSNLMRVLGNEAIMEPSAMEQKVRQQMAERVNKHEEANEEKKLTPEQIKEKKRKKLTEDTTNGVTICVFRAGDLTDGKRRFQVDVHAQQFQLTGAAVIYGNCNVVVVEGGPKNMKKFIRLMEHRIKWVPDHIVDEGSDDEGNGDDAAAMKKIYKKCAMVWKGVSSKRSFKAFRFELCRAEATARKIFKDKGVPQYWDMCRNYQDPS